MFELKHLKTLAALATTHSLAKTAQELFMTESALSHQIKELEHRLGGSLFTRKTVPIDFTLKGEQLLKLAQQILPLVEQTRQSLMDNKLQQLRISVECHACFSWLLPAVKAFKSQNIADLTIEFSNQTVFSAEQALLQKQAELVFTSDNDDHPNIGFESIGEFEMVLVMAPQHPLAEKTFIVAQDLADQTILTYPVEPLKLDVYRLFLQPAKIKPAQWRKVAQADVLVQMVAADMGVAVLPLWAVSRYQQNQLVTTRPLTATGIHRVLYGAYRQADHQDANLAAFLALSKVQFRLL